MSERKLTVALTRRWPEVVEGRLAEQFNLLKRIPDAPMTRGELAEVLEYADIVCPTVTDTLDQSLLSQPSVRAKLLANFGVGYNHIDLVAAKAADIAVTNTPGVLTDATAEIAMSLLLASARRTGEGERLVRAGAWEGWHPTHMLSTQVTGKTLGIVGMGRIGMAMARQAHHGLRMKILYCGRKPLASGIAEQLDAIFCPLDQLLAQADFVSLHCPATPETRHLIDAQALALMPERAFLINTARGDIVDEAALARALHHGVIAGAGLDVFESEPALHPALVDAPGLVMYPHLGSGTRETREAMGLCALANIQAYAAGLALPNEVG